MEKIIQILSNIDNTILAIFISASGGLAHYIYGVSKGEKFSLTMFVINIFLAGWLGYIASGILTTDSKLSGAILSVTGFCTYPLLRIIEAKVPAMWERIIEKK